MKGDGSAPPPLLAGMCRFLVIFGFTALFRPANVNRNFRLPPHRVQDLAMPNSTVQRELCEQPEYLFSLRICGVAALAMGTFLLYVTALGLWILLNSA